LKEIDTSLYPDILTARQCSIPSVSRSHNSPFSHSVIQSWFMC